jgi:hypothetical protein
MTLVQLLLPPRPTTTSPTISNTYTSRTRTAIRLQSGRQGIYLLLQLGNPAVRLLLPLPGRLGDHAGTLGFGAPPARALRVGWVRVAADFEAAAGLARPGFLGVGSSMFMCMIVIVIVIVTVVVGRAGGRSQG